MAVLYITPSAVRFLKVLLIQLIKLRVERRRVKTTGGSTRWEKIVWGGIKVAFSLWLIIGVFNLVNHGTWKGAKGSYREISEDQQQRSHGVSASGLTPTWTFDSSQNNLQANTKYEPFSSIATSSQQSPRIRVTGSPQPPSRSRSPAVGLSRPSSPDQDAADGGDLASCRGHQRISFPGFTRLAGPYHAQRSDASY